MAMTAQVKAELASTQVTKTCCRKAEVASMLRFAGGLHIVSDNPDEIWISRIRADRLAGASMFFAALPAAWVNYLGVPALALPCGFDSRGLPISLQLVARPFAEATLLAMGRAYQRATDWHRRVPA